MLIVEEKYITWTLFYDNCPKSGYLYARTDDHAIEIANEMILELGRSFPEVYTEYQKWSVLIYTRCTFIRKESS